LVKTLLIEVRTPASGFEELRGFGAALFRGERWRDAHCCSRFSAIRVCVATILNRRAGVMLNGLRAWLVSDAVNWP
jgi:hypothetical protein